MSDPDANLLASLMALVGDEQAASRRHLVDIWERPLHDKVVTGWSQAFTRLEAADDSGALWAYLPDDGQESRFREGDLLALHTGSPLDERLLGRTFAFEAEEDDRWLLVGKGAAQALRASAGRACWGDPDEIDLGPYYQSALEDIRSSAIGQDLLLPLLDGRLEITFDDRDIADGERLARADGCNDAQARAVGLALGAEQVAWIQGPPGTGKTRVLALAVRAMTRRGERVLVTSHTHMAIHNVLNKVFAEGVPAVKVGRTTRNKGLDDAVPLFDSLGEWDARPTNGYAVGATPFATCTARLESWDFDTVVFDEASQVTVPLALMAMRKGRRFVFVGDQAQLPPVLRSRSVLDYDAPSMFARLTSRHADHGVMLNQTYRMNRWLAAWPSRVHYRGALVPTGRNRERRLALSPPPRAVDPVPAKILAPSACGVFVPTLDARARTRNVRDAELVCELCVALAAGGLALDRIGIVTPYRAQGRAIRRLLARAFGHAASAEIVADTVERMQGQEREVIIVSLATGDVAFLAAVAPFFFQAERLNVAVTRAMTKLVVIGPVVDPDAAPWCDIPTPAEHGTREQHKLRGWITQYADLVAHLERVDVDTTR
jgi:DNA replication ATP-dependent helicase Dna2